MSPKIVTKFSSWINSKWELACVVSKLYFLRYLHCQVLIFVNKVKGLWKMMSNVNVSGHWGQVDSVDAFLTEMSLLIYIFYANKCSTISTTLWKVRSVVPSTLCSITNTSILFLHTVGGSVGLEEVGEQALLDGGIPTQGLLVQDEQEAVELHEELVQHWRHRQTRGSQRDGKIKIPLC